MTSKNLPRLLIRLLKKYEKKGTHTALVVALEDRTEVVLARDKSPVKKLQGLIKQGGVPVGFSRIRIDHEDGKAYVEMRLLPGCEDDENAKDFMQKFNESVDAKCLGWFDSQDPDTFRYFG